MLEGWTARDGGRVLIRPGYEELVTTGGLDKLEALFELEEGRLVKRSGERREIRRLSLGSKNVFLKRIYSLDGPEAHQARRDERQAGAWAETRAGLLLERLSIPTTEAIVVGGAGQRSCLLTLALAGTIPLARWAQGQGTLAPTALRRGLIRLAADMAARLHQAGYYHQDFNLHHLLYDQDQDNPRLYLVDLQRLRPLPWPAALGRIKDIAEITFSAAGRLRPRDEMAFALAYTGRRRGFRERLFFWAARAKARRIARHTVRHGL